MSATHSPTEESPAVQMALGLGYERGTPDFDNAVAQIERDMAKPAPVAAPITAPSADSPALYRSLGAASDGYWNFPSWFKNRHPTGWPQMATRDAATIRQWFTGRYSDCWPSIATGKFGDGSQSLIVVDFDPEGLAALSDPEFRKRNGLVKTRTHKTPRGGYHLVYRVAYPGVSSGTHVLAKGIDIRSKGGLIHFGEGYEVVDDSPIAPASPELIAACKGITTDSQPADRARDQIDPEQDIARQRAEEIEASWEHVEGQRNVNLRDLIYAIRERTGIDSEGAMEVGMMFADRTGCPESEARATIRSAIRSAQSAAGSKGLISSDFPEGAGSSASVMFDAVMDFAPPVPTEAPATTAANDSEVAEKAKDDPVLLWDFAEDGVVGQPYVIKGLLSRASYTVLHGQPGAGKTFVAFDMGYHVAAGKPWHGKLVKQGAVLYLAYEGVGGLKKRAAALKRHYGGGSVPFYVIPAGYNLREQEGRKALGAKLAMLPEVPSLIVIDTLAHALCGGDENSAQDVGAFNNAVQALIRNTGACVMVIHHPPKNGEGPRGSGAIRGACDSEIQVANRTIESVKQRDYELGEAMPFALHPVPLGTDEDGDEITSCVVVPSQAAVQTFDAVRGLKGNNRDAWLAFCEVSGGANDPVEYDDLRELFVKRAYPDGKASAEAITTALRRSIKELVNRGCITARSDGAWERPLSGGDDSVFGATDSTSS